MCGVLRASGEHVNRHAQIFGGGGGSAGGGAPMAILETDIDAGDLYCKNMTFEEAAQVFERGEVLNIEYRMQTPFGFQRGISVYTSYVTDQGEQFIEFVLSNSYGSMEFYVWSANGIKAPSAAS